MTNLVTAPTQLGVSQLRVYRSCGDDPIHKDQAPHSTRAPLTAPGARGLLGGVPRLGVVPKTTRTVGDMENLRLNSDGRHHPEDAFAEDLLGV